MKIYLWLCYNKTLPKEFQENFNDLLLLNRVSSEMHQHDIANSRPLISSSDLDCQLIKLLSVSKTSVLSATDYQHLRATYATIFQHDIPEQTTRSNEIFKSITLYGHFIESTKHPQTKHPAYLLAAWTVKTKLDITWIFFT